MRVATALAAALLLLPAAARGTDSAGALREFVVELRVNGQQADSALVVLRDASGALLVRADDLARLRIDLAGREPVEVEGELYHRLAPALGAQLEFDEQALVAEVMLAPAAFQATRARADSRLAPEVTAAPPGAFLNYDVSAEQTAGASFAGAFTELGVYGSQGVLAHTMAVRAGDGGSGVARLQTTWIRDLPDRTATLRVGDAVTAPGAWGRALRFGGIQFGTNFGTQPTLITTPLLAAGGDAVVPSTVDVFINGRQVASENVPPGPFTIEGLPAVSGAGQMQVVVTDALGRQQVVSQPYYTGASLLRAGLNEYSFEMGSVRRDYGTRSSAYGDMVVAGTFRRGVTDFLTLEAHAEAQGSGAAAAGIDAAWQAGGLGVLSSTLAMGGHGHGDRKGTGFLGGLGFERNGSRMSLFARTQFASRDFAQLGDATLVDRPKLRAFLGTGFNMRRLGSVQLLYGRQSFWEAGQVETVGLSYSLALARAGYLSLFASHSLSGEERSDLMLNWTLAFGERSSATASAQLSRDPTVGQRSRASFAVQQNLPAGSGSGYYLSGSTDQVQRAGYAYQGSAGLAEVEYARRGQDDGWRASAAGGVVATRAGVMTARPLTRSFAVVQVADYEGLTVYVDNQPIGQTDSRGRVLIDNLRAYEANHISIDPAQVPMDASLVSDSMVLTPAYRSGPLVQFPLSRARPVTLRLVQEDGTPVPAGATVVLDGQLHPVGLDGLAFLPDTGGQALAVARWAAGHCAFALEGVAGDGPMPDLGRVPCRRLATGGAP